MFTDFYPVRDGRWIYLQNNDRVHREATLKLLKSAADKTQIAERTAQWTGTELEDAVHAAGGVAAMVRSAQEWREHPQGQAVAQEPLIRITRIGDAPAEPLAPLPRPMSGVRVLDLTRVLAGPISTRSMAAHGADVLRVTAAHIESIGFTSELETGLGKLATRLDLRHPDDHKALQSLIRQADIFVQGYRPQALVGMGFSPDDAIKLRPGLIYVSLNAWGRSGPWQSRRGYDSAVQSANGMAALFGDANRPALLPVSAIDYLSGYLMAAGAMTALARRAREGGSWLVELSLAGVGQWVSDLGTMERSQYESATNTISEADLETLTMNTIAPDGRIRHLNPVVQLSETPPYWERPPVPMAYNVPAWPTR